MSTYSVGRGHPRTRENTDVATTDRKALIGVRLRRAGLGPPPQVIDQLGQYLELLAHWNRRLNLTALPLEPLATESVDRLVVEPLQAAAVIWSFDRNESAGAEVLAVDLGSGGGSPAIPLKIACPWFAIVLVESKGRKCAFLRETVRTLHLANVHVEQARFEDLPMTRPDIATQADVVTFRAVRANSWLWHIVSWLLKPNGRVVWFGGKQAGLPAGFDGEPFAAGVIGTRITRAARQ